MVPVVSNSHLHTAASSACPQWLWPPPRSGPREEAQGPVFWDHRLTAGLAEHWGHFPTDLKIVWVNITTVRQTARELVRREKGPQRACHLETRFPLVWRWRGEGWAHVQMSPPLGLRKEEDTFASPEPTADPCPSNTCSSFLMGPGSMWPGGSRGKRARLVLQRKDLCHTHSTAPRPSVPQPGRTEWDAGDRGRGLWPLRGLPLFHTTHPG